MKYRELYHKYKGYIFAIIMITVSSFVQAYSIEVFIKPSKLITGGFTGLALLFNMIFEEFNMNVSVQFLLVALNLPVALLCVREISKKFVFLSILQIVMSSLFLQTFTFKPIFSTIELNITIGAVIYGMQLVLALKVGGSTGGTDFIALYISNRINRSIWLYVFLFNMMIILIFGYRFGWDGAGYSIVFQFITTKIVDTFYNRYHRITIHIITKKGDQVIKHYLENHRHGMTKLSGLGAYSGENVDLLYTVVSVYEVGDVVNTILERDNHAIINTFKTEHFYGKFYIPPI